jgi:hypothetical protein
MKKLITILILLFTLVSCDGLDSKDEIINEIINLEIKHVKQYNKIQKISKDTIVINYITKLKDSLKNDAIESKITIYSNSGMLFGSLTDSKIRINEYIELCKNN